MKNEEQKIAHINIKGQEQTLKAHLEGTAKRASIFAAEFGCGQIAELCGLLHDIGKNSQEFQIRIRNPLPSNRVDHSTAVAKEIQKINKEFIPLGMIIAGHHSGLLDGGNFNVSTAGDGTYFGRLKNNIPDYCIQEVKEFLEEKWPVQNVSLPSFCKESKFAMSFFIRILYSCLVDADFLDTEAFMQGGQQNLRGRYDPLEMLLKKFEDYVKIHFLEPVERDTSVKVANSKIIAARNEILQECMEKGKCNGQGLYTLTVPTGGGKTIASMGFALQHTVEHQMKRIIYVIPYTSVIDQNGQVFESILGEKNVVEHHSGITDEWKDFDTSEMNEISEEVYIHRKALATENWDAPVIVTTAVQFFESLYGNRSSQCRKLHNLANSVIIFDEAQTLPVAYLKPCIAAMAQLVKNYKSTIVLCTATQPALEALFQVYVPQYKMQEICEKSKRLFGIFKRTQILDQGEISKEELINQLYKEKQILCIVNRRKLAQEFYEAIAKNDVLAENEIFIQEEMFMNNTEAIDDGNYCLTTLLCPADRKRKFEEIKKRLKEGKTCRVIATSLVEAGVDLDFPKVYRQEAGLDSLIQSAGRCNREGKHLVEESKVYSFRLTGEENRFLAQNIISLQETWHYYKEIDEPDAIAYYFKFFRNLLGQENLDQKGILDGFEKGIDGSCFPFAKIKEKFRLIENIMKTVLIPKEETEDWLESIISGEANRNTFRKLGQFGVNVHEIHFKQLWEAGCLEEIKKGIFVLRDLNQYKEDTGLQMDIETGYGILI